MATEALITPALLRWARERDQLSPEDAARRVKVDPTRLLSWESGDTRPSMHQAQSLARALKVPFGCLYLSQPPEEKLALPDLRTIANAARRRPSAELRDMINHALVKQEWYREYQVGEDAPRLSLIGRFSAQSDYKTIAQDVSDTVGIDAELRSSVANADEYLRVLIAKTEVVGVLVLCNGVVENNTHRKLDVKEFRGFAISDEIAPLIFINSDDAKAAQIFTLFHELAHLWIGESGIDSPDFHSAAAVSGSERLCNAVAGEVLVPAAELRAAWDTSKAPEANIMEATKRFKISKRVVLQRAYDIELVTAAVYRQLYSGLTERSHVEKSSSSGGNFYATVYTRNSRTLTNALLTALAEGRVLYTDAARVLDMRVGTLNKVLGRHFG